MMSTHGSLGATESTAQRFGGESDFREFEHQSAVCGLRGLSTNLVSVRVLVGLDTSLFSRVSFVLFLLYHQQTLDKNGSRQPFVLRVFLSCSSIHSRPTPSASKAKSTATHINESYSYHEAEEEWEHRRAIATSGESKNQPPKSHQVHRHCRTSPGRGGGR
ncbi:hypothetical protein T439DRAFT_176345 [Meredithblackwellia eburnea MCA 4105]